MRSALSEYDGGMTTIAEIEKAIENLPPKQVEELAHWLEEFRKRRAESPSVETWLRHARGSAALGTTTANIMAHTRGDE